MKPTVILQIDALIAELESLKTNARLLECQEEKINAHVEQIRALLKSESAAPKRKKAGWAKGFVTYISDDVDEPIDDMGAYS